MAGLLKKGAKGKEVETLQTALNKFGVKPKLKVDGIFGPLTDKAARDAQTKLKVKVDGKVGEVTQAVLKYGKPLPEWDLGSFKGLGADAAKTRASNRKKVGLYDSMAKDIDALDKMLGANMLMLQAYFGANKAPMDALSRVAMELERDEITFEAQRLRDPVGAAKTLAKAKADKVKFDTMHSIAKSHVKGSKSATQAMRTDLRAAISRLEKTLALIEKE